MTQETVRVLERSIRSIPDFPKPGILFRDITTLLKDPKAFKLAVDEIVQRYKGQKIEKVVGVESRGFILGAAVAYELGAGFVPARKKGKLPCKARSVTYSLEYGTDTLEIHEDALKADERVLIVDDLIATGGTVGGVINLVEQFRAKIIGIAFVIELVDLHGKDKLKGYPFSSLIKFEGE
ncbi:MAG TPA: adenine phosphoribosyltransferase [Candidatus Omnitrophota bacterium]|nr:adenine phosphoribosyltransferase [Candidatus Omnitrophota bacterium]HNQ50105.1 adenine phosphoribosyltransferase [Candidatus Omnitrophota bacterium]